MKRNGAVRVCALVLLLAVSAPAFMRTAWARESILAFDVTAQVLPDASLRVTERIRVNIEHKQIKHGIYRVLPTSWNMAGNKRRSHSHTFESVTFDGEPSPRTKTTLSDTVALIIGDEKVMAPLGEHVYEIRYLTTNHVLFVPDRDEIFFNVTGNDWKLPIDEASFTLLAPGGAGSILETTAFTGPRGAKGRDFVMEAKNVFRTTRPLAVGEGLSVAVAWKMGLVARPHTPWADWLNNNREACALAVVGLIVLHFFFCRHRMRERPAPVIPLFSPPEGMSPGYAAALKDILNTKRMLHADMMGAAVNGFIRLDMRDANNIVIHSARPEKTAREWITRYCQTVADALTWPHDPCDLTTRKGRIQVGKAVAMLGLVYKKQQKTMWRNNLPLKFGAWLGTFALACCVSLVVDDPEASGESQWEYITNLVLFYVCTSAGLLALSAAQHKSITRAVRMLCAVCAPGLCLLGSCLVWAQMEGSGFWMFCQHAWLYLMAFLVRRLPNLSRTPEAMPEYTRILGLEMYIRTAEQHRLATLNAPEDTVVRYEEILPYAVALDCADAWQQRFDPLLRAADYAPEWVDKTALTAYNDYSSVVGAMTASTAMSTALAACVAANRDAGLSSGGSGFSSDSGSSSGGGSGGGGGGGW